MNEDFEKFPRQEFMDFWRAHEGHQRSLWFIACYVAGMLLFAIAAPLIEDRPWIAILWFPLFFGYLILFPLWFSRVRGNKTNARFLKCPSCSAPLNGAGHMVVTATGNCGACGVTICK